ncbi:MAG TPA: hypothetical protein VIL07_04245 [Symbiobacteriaceae bacterium]
MTDRFDEELRKRIKAEMEQALKGWEFTPAMAQQVLERIAAGESGTGSVPAKGPTRPALARFVRSGAWGIAAAAAVLLLVYTGLDHLRPEHSGQPSGQVDSAAKVQEGESLTLFDSRGTTEWQAGAAAAPTKDAVVADAPRESKVETLPAPPEVRLTGTGQAEATETGTRSADPGEQATDIQGDATGTVMPTGVPESTDPPSPGRRICLPVPAVPDMAGVFGTVMMESAAGEMEAPAPGGGRVERSETGVRLVEAGGQVLWEVPLAGPPGPTQLAVSPSGRVAAALGSRLYLLNSTGYLEQAIALPTEPVEVLWAGPDLLAVADSDRVTLSRNGLVVWAVPFGARGMAAAPGSSLLLVWNEAEAAVLQVSSGQEVWRAAPDAAGPVLIRGVLSPEGRQVALLAATDGGFALWVLDSAGNLLLADAMAARPSIDFQGDQLKVELPDGVRLYPLSR